jgi:hypothetical protein
MQSTQKKGKTGFTGLKILIGALSLTGTVGIWGLIASKSVEAAQPPQNNGKDNQQDANSIAMELPPLPTLVPIQNSVDTQNLTQQNTNPQPQTLRQVSVPTLAPAPASNKPVFELLTVNRPGSSSNGGGGGSSSGSSR